MIEINTRDEAEPYVRLNIGKIQIEYDALHVGFENTWLRINSVTCLYKSGLVTIGDDDEDKCEFKADYDENDYNRLGMFVYLHRKSECPHT